MDGALVTDRILFTFVIIAAPKIRVVKCFQEEEYNKPHIAIHFRLYRGRKKEKKKKSDKN